jgi:Rrf2 family nitric oxide-sensitive transcriptional repressor
LTNDTIIVSLQANRAGLLKDRMKLITRDTDYALRSICYIACHKKKRVTVSDLVRDLNVPRPFLRKLLQLLNRQGTLSSYKGRGGGFLLKRPAERIFLSDLIRTFQGPLELNECFLKKTACPNIRVCLLRRKIKAIEQYVITQLKDISVADLIRGYNYED